MDKRRKLTDEQKEIIVKSFLDGKTISKIVFNYNITLEAIRQVLIKSLGDKYFNISKSKKEKFKKIKEEKEKKILLRKKLSDEVKQGKRFSIKFKRCIDCGRIKVKHQANGRCTACYSRYRYANDESFRKQRGKYTRNWMKKNPEKVREIARRCYKNNKLKNLLNN
jgi:hypothetical protein